MSSTGTGQVQFRSPGSWLRRARQRLSRGYQRIKPYLIPVLLAPIGMGVGIPTGGGLANGVTIKFGNLTLTRKDAESFLFLKVTSEKGCHVKPATELAEAVRGFSAEVRVHKHDGDSGDLKSIMSLLSLEIGKGNIVVVTFQGEEAVEAREAAQHKVDHLAAAGERLGRILDFSELVEELFPSTPSQLVPYAGSVATEAPLPEGFLRGEPGNYYSVVEGEAFVIDNRRLIDRFLDLPPAENEVKKFQAAVATVAEELERAIENRGEDKNGFSVTARNWRLLRHFSANIQEMIRREGLGTGAAAQLYLKKYQGEDGGLFDDVRAIMEDVILTRYGTIAEVLDQIEVAEKGRMLLVVSTLTPLTALHVAAARDKIKGVVTEKKLNRESHQVILLDDAQIPIVTGLVGLASQLVPGQKILVDSREGIVVADVLSEEAGAYFNRRFYEGKFIRTTISGLEIKPRVRTLDGREIELLVNTERNSDLLGDDFPGVGLNRTEFSFIHTPDGTLRESEPSLDELFDNYLRFLWVCAGRPAIIRTFDFEPTKRPKYFNRDLIREAIEMGPEGYLLYDGTPETLKFKKLSELFRTQVRAFLLATAVVANKRSGDIQPGIMFPMISSESMFLRAKGIVEEERLFVGQNEESFIPNLQVGSMIETPSAVRQVGAIAQHADFISIGTNDLKAATHIELGFRDAEEAVNAVEGIPPKLMRYIYDTARATEKLVKRVCCCGVLASSPRYAPLLIGAGVNSLSVTRGQLRTISFLVENITFSDARDLVTEVLGLGTVEEADKTIDKRVEGLIKPAGAPWRGLEPIRYLMTGKRSIQEIIEQGRTI